jgi:23S rRNA (cytidine1920-2'-O)/16S rRNA (cytidine1409-2'-O)-methyltransferase
MGLASPQVAEKIRQDDRVIIMERTNLRYLERLPERVDLVTLDLSFISILLVSAGRPVGR